MPGDGAALATQGPGLGPLKVGMGPVELDSALVAFQVSALGQVFSAGGLVSGCEGVGGLIG